MPWICRDAESSGADEKAPPSKTEHGAPKIVLGFVVRVTRPKTSYADFNLRAPSASMPSARSVRDPGSGADTSVICCVLTLGGNRQPPTPVPHWQLVATVRSIPIKPLTD